MNTHEKLGKYLQIFLTESEQGVAHAIIRGKIDFEREPWPSISDSAKSLVRLMLEPDPNHRLSAKQVLGKLHISLKFSLHLVPNTKSLNHIFLYIFLVFGDHDVNYLPNMHINLASLPYTSLGSAIYLSRFSRVSIIRLTCKLGVVISTCSMARTRTNSIVLVLAYIHFFVKQVQTKTCCVCKFLCTFVSNAH